MKESKEAQELKIYISENDKCKGITLYEAIVAEAKKLSLSGVTVFRGVLGFGREAHIHSTKLLRLSDDLPVVIEIVDSEQNISKIMPFIEDNIKEGLITVCKVQACQYSQKEKG